MKDGEEGQRGDAEPKAFRSDAGKAQEDLAEEGEDEGEYREVEREVEQTIQKKIIKKSIDADDKYGQDDGTCADGAGKDHLYAEDECMLRPVGADEDEVEDDIRCIAGKKIDVLVGLEGERKTLRENEQ